MLNFKSEKIIYYEKYKFNNPFTGIKLSIKDIVKNTLIILIPFIIPFLNFDVKKLLTIIIFIFIYTIKSILHGNIDYKIKDVLVVLPSIIILIYIFFV